MNHTPTPWRVSGKVTNTTETVKIRTYNKVICEVAAYESYNVTISEANANLHRIVECVNACEGQNLEDVKLATEHKDACLLWESSMMKAIGEDGVGSVSDAIEKLKSSNQEMLEALKIARKQLLKSGINVDNADLYNTIDKAIKSVEV